MNRGGRDGARDRWSIAFGVLGFALMTMPWPMPLLWWVLKRLRRPCERSGVRRARATDVMSRGNASLTSPDRGPIPAH